MRQDTQFAPPEAAPAETDQREAALAWLAEEFPAWTFSVGTTDTYTRRDDQHWTATQVGHHPQSALTAAKLHTRLDEYLARRANRGVRQN